MALRNFQGILQSVCAKCYEVQGNLFKETLDQCSDLHKRKFLGSKETSGGNANIVHSVLYAHMEF